jgi:hypothetical protein
MRVSAIKDEIAASLRRPDRCVLIHLAIADGKLITISDIAESFDISNVVVAARSARGVCPITEVSDAMTDGTP